MGEFVLSTIDNPYDPFKEWEEWYKFDMTKGYDTCGYLAKVANTSLYLNDELNEEEIERAAKEIVNAEPTIYKIIYRNKNQKRGEGS